MATLVFNSLGNALGGPVGGAIGAMIGSQLDGALLGGTPRDRGRLKELELSASTYGQPIPRHFGRMRVGGSIIWATDLVESSLIEGGTKGGASSRSFSYQANFAVALASRPILGLGRIWADGNLLRGAAGDLKVGGTLRLYTGKGDQAPDPLIVANECEARCPAYRGLAYVVFEGLDVSEFYNRIPTLTFEVIADEDFTLSDVISDVVPDAQVDVTLDSFRGFSCDGAVIDSLSLIEQVLPLATHAQGQSLVVTAADDAGYVHTLGEATRSFDDDDFGTACGFTRSRNAPGDAPPSVLRYYDVARDYLPGLQRASGRAGPGQPASLDLPAALDPQSARTLIERTARRHDWSRERMAWRTAELDTAIMPGAIVTVPGHAGQWRVASWEWRSHGIELALTRCLPTGATIAPALAATPGRAGIAPDRPSSPTSLVAFEMPWDGLGTRAPTQRLFAATSSSSVHWRGAALYLDSGDGALIPLGGSGRTRSVIGLVPTAMGGGHPALFDTATTLDVTLLDETLILTSATLRDLADGANLALVGSEIVQFAHARALGQGRWRLTNLLRGRGGTETAIQGHTENESFVLLDGRATALDTPVGTLDGDARIVAIGLGDSQPVISPVHLQGIAAKPLAPVHPRQRQLDDGALELTWVRCARGGWAWQDGTDVPLVEETERYMITAGPIDAPLATWIIDTPRVEIAPDDLQRISGLDLRVRQQGTLGLSAPLLLARIP